MIDIVENTGHAGGYATIFIREPIPDGVTITGLQIRRSGTETNVLGPRGWQAKPAALQPRSIEIDDQGAKLEIGPEIVDAIEPDTLVTLVVSGPEIAHQLFWPHITRSPFNNPDRFNASRPKGQPTPQSDDEHEIEEEPTNPGGTVEEEPKGRGLLLILVLLIILTICFVLAWWYFKPPSGQEPEPPSISYQERYRQLLETDETGAELLALHHEISQGDTFDENVAFQALQAAAIRKGNADAQMGIAALYDPFTFDHRFFSAPNPTQAAAEYDKAIEMGSTAASDAKRSMCAAAERPSPEHAEAFASFDPSVSCR